MSPAPEQASIARILDAADSAIDSTHKAIEKAQRVKKALMQKLLGDAHLPVRKMGAFIADISYGTSKASNDRTHGYPTLRIPNVVGDTIDTTDLTYVEVSGSERRKYSLYPGDLLLVRTNGNPSYIGRSAVFSHKDNETWLYASYLIRVRFSDELRPKFVDEFLKSERGRRELFRRVTTSAGNYNINTQSIKAIPVPLFDPDQQDRIVGLTDAANEELRTLAKQESVLLQSQARPHARPSHRQGANCGNRRENPRRRGTGASGDRRGEALTEQGYVEKPILEWLAGNLDDPTDLGMGWTYRSPEMMESYGRNITDPLVEAILIPAIMRINDSVNTEDQARKVISVFRRIMAAPDLLTANRETLSALADGISVVLSPGEDATTVRLIESDPCKRDLNDFTVTNQYPVKGTKTCKADTVLLVNGIPVVVAEYKSYISSSHDWTEGVRQVHRYQREAPALLATNIFCVAADEQEFRYGAVAFAPDSEKAISAQMEYWNPWLSQYPKTELYWTLPEGERDDDKVRAAAHGLLLPGNVIDFIENFVVFETSKGKTVKKIARYQQFEAANDIVDRVLDGSHKTGLIWHTQGSGKSLTMVYAGYKLRRQTALDNPTVYIVVDRTDLKTQIADEFEYRDYPNVVKAMGVRDLKSKIAGDRRETIVTTIQCFQAMNDLQPNLRHNIIMMIDEAHRSQKGGSGLRGGRDQAASFAMTMRAKMPHAFRFGFTGTPIDRTMVNTHREFGPIVDGEQERYLSYYGIRQSITDGATLEVHYKPSYIPVRVDEKPLNVSFEQMCTEMELEDEEEKDFLQRKEARWKALVKDSRRIKEVISHMVEHFLEHPDPNGFKAQLVTIDREACSMYKDEIDAQLTAAGYPAQWSDVDYLGGPE